MKLYELAFACFCYAGFTNNDKQYNEFLKKISPNLDIKNKAHRDDLLKWLNDWGCRQFELDSHQDA